MSENFDEDALQRMKEIMGDDFLKLVDTYLRNAEIYVQSVLSGFEQKDAKVIEDAAHPLKSSSANLGAAKFSHVAETVEYLAKSVQGGDAEFDALAAPVGALEALFLDVQTFLNAHQ